MSHVLGLANSQIIIELVPCQVIQQTDFPTLQSSHCREKFHTFLTIVSFGFRTAKPPGGNLGAPVTNWQKARCCSGVNSPIISSN